MQKLSITFVTPTAAMSGGIRVIGLYADRLSRMGHKVQVVSQPAAPIPLGQKLKSLLKGRGLPKLNSRSHFDEFSEPTFQRVVLDRMRPVTDSDLPDADVVIATWWETAEWVAALAPSKGAKVYFVQGYEVYPHLPVERCHAAYRLPLHKIVIARWLADLMREKYGATDVSLVPNSVDRGLFFAPQHVKQQTPSIGFLYNTAHVKGTDAGIECARQLRKLIPDLRIISFGSQRPTSTLPLPPDTDFFFNPPQQQLRDLYALCDVWLMPSRVEGFGLTAIEAMACRTPLVSTKTGWPAEAIVNGWNGYLVDVDDVNAMVDRCAAIVGLDNEAWTNMALAAEQTATSGSWDQSAKLFEAALQRAIELSPAHDDGYRRSPTQARSSG